MRTVFLANLVVVATYVAAAPHDMEKQIEATEKVKSVTGETVASAPKYWRAILGDICQLPSFPRATGDPTRYIECAKSGAEATNRKDLGIWLLRECLPNYEFVASARRCKTVRSIRRQQQICDGPNAANYQFCPAKQNNEVKFVVREIRQAPIACTCPNGEQNCVCPSPEILEPIAIVAAPVAAPIVAAPTAAPTNPTSAAPAVTEGATEATPATVALADGTIIEESSVVLPDAPRALAQTYGQCPCPAQMPNCICQPAPVVTQPPVADPCCAPQQQPPCQCQQPGPIPLPQPVTQPPQVCPQQCPQPQSPSCQCQPVATPTVAACPCPQDPSCQCQPSTPPQCQTTTTQQQYCPQPQSPVVMPQPCPLVQGGVQNAQYQGICSWMIDPLAADPTSRNCFLQCQPAPNNLFCGRWQRMPCAPATIFDVTAQVCVWDPNAQPGPIPAPQPYVAAPAPSVSQQCGCSGGVQIGSCNQNYQCPGQSVCQVAQPSCPVCCYFHKKKQLF